MRRDNQYNNKKADSCFLRKFIMNTANVEKHFKKLTFFFGIRNIQIQTFSNRYSKTKKMTANIYLL